MRILFITSTYLGDAILSTGILDNLQKTYPLGEFYIACGPTAAPLFEALPRRVHTYIIRKQAFSFHWITLWLQCVFKVWDLVVDVRGSGLSYGLLARHRKIWKSSSRHTLRVHEIARWFGLKETPQNKIWTTLENKKEAEDFLPEGPSYIAFSPTANWDKKRWPIESFIALGKKILKDQKNFPHARLVILGTTHQRAEMEPLFEAFQEKEILDLMGKPSLTTLSLCLSRCRVFIGNDSGLMHLAAASHTPTVGIFGPSPCHIYGPWGQRTAIVSLPESQEVIFARIKKGEVVMEDISVETVYKTVSQLVQKS